MMRGARFVYLGCFSLLLTGCGPSVIDVELNVDKIDKSLHNQVVPSDTTLARGIRDCSILINNQLHSKSLIKNANGSAADSGAIYRYRHEAAVFLSNMSPEFQSKVAQANPLAFPGYDPARHEETAFRYLEENP